MDRIHNGKNVNGQTVWKNKLFSIGLPPFLREGLENEEESDENVEEDTTEETQSTSEPTTETPTTDTPTETPTGTPIETPAQPQSSPGVLDGGLKTDANYKNVNLPSLVTDTTQTTPTQKPKKSNWKPPINQVYANIPNGSNAKPGSVSDVIYSPANDQDFIRTTIAKIADIITPPPPVPLPKPTRPTEPFQSKNPDDNEEEDDQIEPLQVMAGLGKNKLKSSIDVPMKQKRLIRVWKDWVKNRTKVDKLGKAVTVTINSIFETFYVPELIAVGIVNPSYSLSSHKTFYSREDYTNENKDKKYNYDQYNQDVVTLTKQLNMFILTAFSFFAAFNWWYVIFYNDHYIDINDFLVSETFTPVSIILGPALAPTAGINYVLLGKRLQKSFYGSLISPIVNNKWLTFSLFLIMFMSIYPIWSSQSSASFDDIMKGEPNEFFKVIIALGFIYYLFGIPSRSFISPFWKSIFRLSYSVGFIFSFIYIIILFILMIVMMKFSTMFLIIFFMFYSNWSMILFGGPNIFSTMSRIIIDSTETCDVPNPTNDTFISLLTWFKKNLTYIVISIIYFTLVVRLLDDTEKNIANTTVKGSCITIYSLLLIVQIFAIIWINSEKANMVSLGETINNANNAPTPSATMTDELKEYKTVVEQIGYIGYLLGKKAIRSITGLFSSKPKPQQTGPPQPANATSD